MVVVVALEYPLSSETCVRNLLFFLKLARLVRGICLSLDAYHKDGKSAFVTDDNDRASVTLVLTYHKEGPQGL